MAGQSGGWCRGGAAAAAEAQLHPESLHQMIKVLNIEGLHVQRTTTDRAIEAIRADDESLEIIDLSAASSTITSQQLRDLTLGLEANEYCKTLGMKCLGISDKGAVQFSSMLRKNKALTAIDLGWNKIGSHGAQHLALALPFCTVLRELHIAGNTEVGDVGASSIAQALEHNKALEVLDLSWTTITLDGALNLAQMLQCDNGLNSLQLMGNTIGFAGALAIINAVHNRAFKFLGLAGNQVGEDARDSELGESIRRCAGLRAIDLRNNAIPLSAANEISAALIENNAQLGTVKFCSEVAQEDEDRTIGYLYL